MDIYMNIHIYERRPTESESAKTMFKCLGVDGG